MGRDKNRFTKRPGLIPACAGKTALQSWCARLPGAHPRMRGENARERAGDNRGWGSSPHARGKRSRLRGRRHLGRLIPACAGKTLTCGYRVIRSRAHPRMRGENVSSHPRHHRTRGSSPHARGKHKITFPTLSGTVAHPRMRGENGLGSAPFSLRPGSSPHARGKPGDASAFIATNGLIPACAGKTPIPG